MPFQICHLSAPVLCTQFVSPPLPPSLSIHVSHGACLPACLPTYLSILHLGAVRRFDGLDASLGLGRLLSAGLSLLRLRGLRRVLRVGQVDGEKARVEAAVHIECWALGLEFLLAFVAHNCFVVGNNHQSCW